MGMGSMMGGGRGDLLSQIQFAIAVAQRITVFDTMNAGRVSS